MNAATLLVQCLEHEGVRVIFGVPGEETLALTVNYISTAKIEAGVPAAEAYNSTMFIMAGLLVIGLIANLLVRPVDPKYHLAELPKV